MKDTPHDKAQLLTAQTHSTTEDAHCKLARRININICTKVSYVILLLTCLSLYSIMVYVRNIHVLK